MDQESISLAVGERIEVMEMKGSWAVVRTEAGQVGDVPVICLNLEDARTPPSQGSTEAGMSPPSTVQAIYYAADTNMFRSQRSLPASDPSLIGMQERVAQYETQTYETVQMYEVP